MPLCSFPEGEETVPSTQPVTDTNSCLRHVGHDTILGVEKLPESCSETSSSTVTSKQDVRHRIDGLSLLALTEADLRGPPLSLTVLGDIKRLTVALRRLQMENKPELEELGLWPLDSLSAGLELGAPRAEWSCDGAERRGCNGADHLCNGPVLRLRNSSSLGCVPRAVLCQTHSNGGFQQPMAGRLDPEVWKTVISSIYVFLVCGLTSFVMVVVHERVPDMRTYPPLPDIFLDSVPRIPWAFVMAEACGLILCYMFLLILLLHKHRYSHFQPIPSHCPLLITPRVLK
ncbi:hypothetical protein ILYODFUR_016414 [Ilyodon furcidens]|uniref:Uncharacterized protein n=1 Tax=Ilyodon furcidens TaxID=33524 RepID=A0ABV0SPM4_9TELE